MEKYKLIHIFTDGINAVTGLIESKKDGHKYIFKYSGSYASCILHEYNVLKRLETLGLPNFPKVHDFPLSPYMAWLTTCISLSTIMRTNCLKLTLGFHLRTRRALELSPKSKSTSVGRK